MSEWTEGVMADGAAILRNGQMVTISELLEILNGMEAAIAAEREACAKIADESARVAGEKLKAAISKGDAEYEGFRGIAMSAYEIAAAIRSSSKEGP